MEFIAKKPQGTFYSDYTIQDGFVYAIFEHDSRTSNIRLGKTDKTNQDWKSFDILDTSDSLIINLGL